jgi:sec-independent protein translocase protein TatB
MFEVGFQELALIFGVALMVLGPTRLPGLVSKIGRWVGKARTMARDFRQQLENEVNLEELNKMTDLQTKAAHSTPPPPPELSGEPLPATVPTYPYAAPDTAVTDDTYSHAHAEGAEPMPYVPESNEAPVQSPTESPIVADHGEASPTLPELSMDDLPPDDARRHT